MSASSPPPSEPTVLWVGEHPSSRLDPADVLQPSAAVHLAQDLASVSAEDLATADLVVLTEPAALSAALGRDQRLADARRLEVLGRLVGGVAHDFNNVLSVITTLSELLVRFSDDHPDREDLEEIHAAAVRGAELSRQLLTFLRADVGAPRAVDLNGRIRSAEKLFRKLLPEDVVLEVELAAELPPTYADPLEIDQIILNLAAHGREALASGGSLILRTALGPDGGPRLEAELQPRAGSGPVHSEPGASLPTGLDAVREIVASRGGAIAERSNAEGDRVTVDLVRHPSMAVDTPGPGASALRVLVVEDDDDVRSGLLRTLSVLGHEAEGVPSAQAARDRIASGAGRPDVVLCDAVLPDGWGSELRRDTEASGDPLLFLFLSGHADHPALADIRAMGGPLLRKPVAATELAAALAEIRPRRVAEDDA